jgi:centromeric protein E
MTFLLVSQHKEREFILKFSALEIYNEAVKDLLNSNATTLRLLDDPEVNLIAVFPKLC